MPNRPEPRAGTGGGEPLDLLSRLERLRPPPQPPSLRLRILRKAWLGVYFIVMFVPLSAWTVVQWRIYSSDRAAAGPQAGSGSRP